MTTGAFSRNVGKLFSELKLVTDNLLLHLWISWLWHLNWELVYSSAFDSFIGKAQGHLHVLMQLHTYLDHDNWGNQIPRIITWFSCDFIYVWTTHFYCITLKPHSTVCLITLYLQWCSLVLPIIHPHTWMFAEACC